jgi:anaerobic magnesium-protoporphyrin IX monomethyl ester cyclase
MNTNSACAPRTTPGKTDEKIDVLLVYPTLYKVTGLPIGLASLCASLKQADLRVRVFDTCFYGSDDRNQLLSRAKIMSTLPIEGTVREEEHGADPCADLMAIAAHFEPKIIGVMITENTFRQAISLINSVKENFANILIVVGGIFPSLSPDVFTKEDSIDAICIGEGEHSLTELCGKVINGEDYSSTKGFLIKKDGVFVNNGISDLPDINKLPFPDFTEFDELLAYKPMQGRMRKMIFAESIADLSF